MTYTLTLSASPNPISITGTSTLTASCSTIPNQYQFYKGATLLQTNQISLSSLSDLTNGSYSSGSFKGVATDNLGNIYVIYNLSDVITVLKFNSNLTTLAYSISGTNAFGIIVDSTYRVYITSQSSKWIKRYDPTGTTLQLQINLAYTPYDIAVDQNNNIYVASFYTQFIYVYDSTGSVIFTISIPSQAGHGATGITVDNTLPYPNIYFCSPYNVSTGKGYSGCAVYSAFTTTYSISYVENQNYLNPVSVQLLNNDNYLVMDTNASKIYQRQTSNGNLIKTYSYTPSGYSMSYNQTNNILYRVGGSNKIYRSAFGITNTYTATSYGNYSVTADFGNSFTLSSSTTLFSIPYTLTWGPLTAITYGDPLPAGYLNATSSISGTFSYNYEAGDILPAEEITGDELIATFTPSNLNIYEVSQISNYLIVNKYTPTIDWTSPLQPINTTTPLTAESELNAVALSYDNSVLSGTYVYTNVTTSTIINVGDTLPTGTNSLSVAFTPTDASNYNSNTGTNSILVDNLKQVVTIIWNTPSPIDYGTALSGTQLNATAEDSIGNPVAGTFIYVPPIGTILSAGIRVLRCLFQPIDSATYYDRRSMTMLTVNTIDVNIQWNNPNDIFYTTPLSSTQLDAEFYAYDGITPLTGTTIYNPPSGTFLGYGYQTLSVTFNPTNTNYNTTTKTVTIFVLGPITVSPQTVVITKKNLTQLVTFTGAFKYDIFPNRGYQSLTSNQSQILVSPFFSLNYLIVGYSPQGLKLEEVLPVKVEIRAIEELDIKIIPYFMAEEVYKRQKERIWDFFREDPKIVRQLTNFFYEQLQMNYQDVIKGKSGSCAVVPWISEFEYIFPDRNLVIPSIAQYELLRYVYEQQQKGLKTNSNFGYLMFVLGDFMKNLQQAMLAYNSKQENITCYYYLGKNINSPQQLYKFLLRYIY